MAAMHGAIAGGPPEMAEMLAMHGAIASGGKFLGLKNIFRPELAWPPCGASATNTLDTTSGNALGCGLPDAVKRMKK